MYIFKILIYEYIEYILNDNDNVCRCYHLNYYKQVNEDAAWRVNGICRSVAAPGPVIGQNAVRRCFAGSAGCGFAFKDSDRTSKTSLRGANEKPRPLYMNGYRLSIKGEKVTLSGMFGTVGPGTGYECGTIYFCDVTLTWVKS